MNEWNKAQAGYLYDANYDREVVENRTKCADLCYEFNPVSYTHLTLPTNSRV